MGTKRSRVRGGLAAIIVSGGALGWGAGACDSRSADDTQQAGLEQKPSSESLETIDSIPPGYSLVPGGMLAHQDCIHQVPDGAEVHEDLSVTVDGKKIAQYAKCAQKMYRYGRPAAGAGAQAPAVELPTALSPVAATTPTGNGWVENAFALSSEDSFTQMNSGTWVVPNAPALSSQTVYLKAGLSMNGSPAYIVESVLQWGYSSTTGGGNAWLLANWVVYGQNALFVSPVDFVNVGDSIDSTITAVGTATYKNTVRVQNTGWSTSLTASVCCNLTNAVPAVLEAYNLTACNQFPDGVNGHTYFSRPVLYQGNSWSERTLLVPTWILQDYNYNNWTGPNCNFAKTWVDSVGNATLYY